MLKSSYIPLTSQYCINYMSKSSDYQDYKLGWTLLNPLWKNMFVIVNAATCRNLTIKNDECCISNLD